MPGTWWQKQKKAQTGMLNECTLQQAEKERQTTLAAWRLGKSPRAAGKKRRQVAAKTVRSGNARTTGMRRQQVQHRRQSAEGWCRTAAQKLRNEPQVTAPTAG